MCKHIFISYARLDGRALALQLRTDLEALGYSVWLDTSEIQGGADWALEIENAIEQCDTALALMSQGAYKSEICRGEQQRALRKGKPVIPILVQADAERPLHLEHLNYRDFTDAVNYVDALHQLRVDIDNGASVPLPELHRKTIVSAPALPPHFIVREEALDELRYTVLGDTTDQQIALTALRGMGGIGKSVLATALCHDEFIQDAFPDGIIWVTIGREPGNLTEQMKFIGTKLGDSPGHYTSQTSGHDRLQTILADKAVLLILDDVWDAQHVHPFRLEALRMRTLFTTRDGAIALDVGASEVRLGTLKPTEALELLREWARCDDPAMPEIADRLGYLPLALKLAGVRLREGMSGADWLKTFHHVAQIKLGRRSIAPHENLEVCFDLSVQQLADEDQLLYYTFGVFPEDVGIPQQTVIRLWRQLEPTLSEYDAAELVVDLARLALIDREEASQTITLHDLLHDYTRGKLGDRLSTLHGQLLVAYNPEGLPWYKIPHDGYLYHHLGYHLIGAGKQAAFIDLLLDSPDWMEAKFIACQGDIAYVADLDLALRQYSDPLTASEALKCTSLYVARQLVNVRTSVYSDEDLAVLVRLGRGTEALNHARLRINQAEHVSGLIAIYQAALDIGSATPDMKAEMLFSVRDIGGENRAFLLRLSHLLREYGDLEHEALFYEWLGPGLELWRKVYQVAMQLQSRGEGDFAEACYELAVTERCDQELLTGLVERDYAATAIDVATAQGDIPLKQIIRHCCQTGRLAEALQAAERLSPMPKLRTGQPQGSFLYKPEHERERLLTGLAVYCADAGEVELMRHAGELAYLTGDAILQLVLAHTLTYAGYLDEARTIVKAISWQDWTDKALEYINEIKERWQVAECSVADMELLERIQHPVGVNSVSLPTEGEHDERDAGLDLELANLLPNLSGLDDDLPDVPLPDPFRANDDSSGVPLPDRLGVGDDDRELDSDELVWRGLPDDSSDAPFPDSFEADSSSGLPNSPVTRGHRFDSSQLMHEAFSAYRIGETAKAESLLMQVTELDSYHEAAWVWLGLLQNRLSRSRMCFKKVLTFSPDNLTARYYFASLPADDEGLFHLGPPPMPKDDLSLIPLPNDVFPADPLSVLGIVELWDSLAGLLTGGQLVACAQTYLGAPLGLQRFADWVTMQLAETFVVPAVAVPLSPEEIAGAVDLALAVLSDNAEAASFLLTMLESALSRSVLSNDDGDTFRYVDAESLDTDVYPDSHRSALDERDVAVFANDELTLRYQHFDLDQLRRSAKFLGRYFSSSNDYDDLFGDARDDLSGEDLDYIFDDDRDDFFGLADDNFSGFDDLFPSQFGSMPILDEAAQLGKFPYVVQQYIYALFDLGRLQAAFKVLRPFESRGQQAAIAATRAVRRLDYRKAVVINMMAVVTGHADWKPVLEAIIEQDALGDLLAALEAHQAVQCRLMAYIDIVDLLVKLRDSRWTALLQPMVESAGGMRNPHKAIDVLGACVIVQLLCSSPPDLSRLILDEEIGSDDDLQYVLMSPQLLDEVQAKDLYRSYLTMLRRHYEVGDRYTPSDIEDEDYSPQDIALLTLVMGYGDVAIEILDLMSHYCEEAAVNASDLAEAWTHVLLFSVLARQPDNHLVEFWLLFYREYEHILPQSQKYIELAAMYQAYRGKGLYCPIAPLQILWQAYPYQLDGRSLGLFGTLLLFNDQPEAAAIVWEQLATFYTIDEQIAGLAFCAASLTLVKHPARQEIVDMIVIRDDLLDLREDVFGELARVMLMQVAHGQLDEAGVLLDRLPSIVRWVVLYFAWHDWCDLGDLSDLTMAVTESVPDCLPLLANFTAQYLVPSLRDLTMRRFTAPLPEDFDNELSDLARYLSDAGFRDDALEVAACIQDEKIHDDALHSVVCDLRDVGEYDRAQAVVQRMKTVFAQNEALFEILPDFDWPLDHLMPLVAQLPTEEIRNDVFARLAGRCVDSGKLTDALAYAQRITHVDQRPDLLRKIVQAMLAQGCPKVESVFDELIYTARIVQHRAVRRPSPSLLRHTARSMPPPEAAELAGLLRTVEKKPHRLRNAILCGLAESLCQNRRLVEAEQVVQRIVVEPWRRKALASVVEANATQGLLEVARAIVDEVTDRQGKASIFAAYAAGVAQARSGAVEQVLTEAVAAVEQLPRADYRAAARRTLALKLLAVSPEYAEPVLEHAISETQAQSELLSQFYGLCELLEGLLARNDPRADLLLVQLERLLANQYPPELGPASNLIDSMNQRVVQHLWQTVALGGGPIWEISARLEVSAILNRYSRTDQAQAWLDAALADEQSCRWMPWPMKDRFDWIAPLRHELLVKLKLLGPSALPDVLDMLHDWSPVFAQIDGDLPARVWVEALRLFAWVGYDLSDLSKLLDLAQ